MAIVINGSGTVTGISVGGLPDGIVDAGTLATNSVDSAELVDGSIDTAHIAADQITSAILPAGSVLQVVTAEDSTELSLSSETFTDVGLSAAITPQSASSKILIFWSVHSRIRNNPGGIGCRLVRDSTSVWTTGANYYVYGNWVDERHSTEFKYLDSPSATSATTYKIQVSSNNGENVLFNANGNQSSILLMEIAG